MQTILKWLDRLFYVQIVLAAIMAFSMGLLVFVSATMRYVAGSPLGFSDELVALMFVSTTFLCLPYATRRGLNIKLDLVVKRLDPRARKVVGTVAGLLSAAVLLAFSISAIEEVLFAYEIEEVTNVAELPVYPFKTLVLFSAFSTALATLMVVFLGPLAGSEDDQAILEGIE